MFSSSLNTADRQCSAAALLELAATRFCMESTHDGSTLVMQEHSRTTWVREMVHLCGSGVLHDARLHTERQLQEGERRRRKLWPAFRGTPVPM